MMHQKNKIKTILVASFLCICMMIVQVPSEVKAARFTAINDYIQNDIESRADLEPVYGHLEPGEKEFRVHIQIKNAYQLKLYPLVNYDTKEDDEAYNELIKNRKTDFKIIKNRGTSKEEDTIFYTYNKKPIPFETNFLKKTSLKLEDYTDALNGSQYKKSYPVLSLLEPGNYTVVFRLPEEVTEGARIYLDFVNMTELSDGKTSKYIKQNTKATAQTVKAPYDALFDDPGFAVFLNKYKSNTFWYKVTIPATREISWEFEGDIENEDMNGIFSAYKGSKLIKNYELTEDCDAYWDGVTRKYTKGTYYFKIDISNTNIGYMTMYPSVAGPSRPTITTPIAGAKVIQGKAEVGSRAYAVVAGKTYKAKYITSSKGAYSVAVPKLKAGQKVKVYIKDGLGVKSKQRTVTVKAAKKK